MNMGLCGSSGEAAVCAMIGLTGAWWSASACDVGTSSGVCLSNFCDDMSFGYGTVITSGCETKGARVSLSDTIVGSDDIGVIRADSTDSDSFDDSASFSVSGASGAGTDSSSWAIAGVAAVSCDESTCLIPDIRSDFASTDESPRSGTKLGVVATWTEEFESGINTASGFGGSCGSSGSGSAWTAEVTLDFTGGSIDTVSDLRSCSTSES